MNQPIVAIIGRPNVGKSTLFNRLLHRRRAIEDDRSGVTRDRISEEMDWNGCRFTLIDTGGLYPTGGEVMDKLVSAAAEAAMMEADKVVLVVDRQVPPTETDRDIARMVLKTKIPAILAVTKVDIPEHEPDIHEYYSLGLGDPIGVSGTSGLNSGDLLDLIVDGFEKTLKPKEESTIRVALIGRPNVGKSSIMNRLLGEERQIVSEIPGTTRDCIDAPLRYQGKILQFIDTAGLRRKKELSKESLEYYTVLRTIRALDHCDIAVVILDAVEGLTQYDRRLLDDVREKCKGMIAVINKWDLVEKETGTLEAFQKEIHHQLPDLHFVPFLFTSAITGKRVRKILDLSLEVAEQRARRIPTTSLNQLLEKTLAKQPPPSIKGRWIRIKYCSQVAINPPLFAFFLNYPNLIPEEYKRFLERKLREEYGFIGVPLKLAFRKK